jgi:circadian clock protein KaiC
MMNDPTTSTAARDGASDVRSSAEIVRTGIAGLDEVLGGGLPRSRLYLIQGAPGAGKTTLALQFLLEGVRSGERVLYITLSETKEELLGVAQSHGWSLDGVELFELSDAERAGMSNESQSIFHSSEIDLHDTLRHIFDAVERVRPARVVLDSLSEMWLLAGDPLRYRRQVLSLKTYFADKRATVLLIDDRTGPDSDLQLRSVAHGVIELDRATADFGTIRRRVQIAKLRGARFREGYHDFDIRSGGIVVYPRFVQHQDDDVSPPGLLSSGLPNLDALLGGGLPRGFSLLLLGPAGVGKSTIALQFALAACERGERAALFMFDERASTVYQNCVGAKLLPHFDTGLFRCRKIDPGGLSPGQFLTEVRNAVTEQDVKLVVIDGLDGFLQAMPNEKHLLLHLHELSSFLGRMQVTLILTKVQHGMVGRDSTSGADLTYLSDAALLLRYFEFRGAIRQALSVVKKRGGSHERAIRELSIGADGPELGPQLESFHGILSGIPVYHGDTLEGGRK